MPVKAQRIKSAMAHLNKAWDALEPEDVKKAFWGDLAGLMGYLKSVLRAPRAK